MSNTDEMVGIKSILLGLLARSYGTDVEYVFVDWDTGVFGRTTPLLDSNGHLLEVGDWVLRYKEKGQGSPPCRIVAEPMPFQDGKMILSRDGAEVEVYGLDYFLYRKDPQETEEVEV